ncbi:hypothetical protein N0V93_002166 [Gnomoniopsis smithogilvyi]|uniref:Uncharacterized protein n=1 Tax=Gnomoniopsis smithogilvyi TaxID=1191159 RepID=A0A9W8YY45_9PEZI|nr:hypothetical protein N0V93_002166 [Gnomoniopsis smithogilvyi]
MQAPQSSQNTGEGASSSSSSSSTIITAADGSPLTGLAYLKSEEKLPRLIKVILNMPEELARVSKDLCDLPMKRKLSYHEFKNPKLLFKFDAADNSHIGTVKPHYNVTALLVFVTGNEMKGEEACCEWENKPTCLRGIFPLSVVPANPDDKELTSKKACANCQYDGMGSKCPLQTRANMTKKRKAKVSNLDGQIDDDEDDDEYSDEGNDEDEEDDKESDN